MKKKSLFVCAGLCAAMVLASCGTSKESAYKKAYEKAKAQEQVVEQQPVAQAPVVAPVVEQPVNQAPVVDNVDNVSVRSENVTLIDGAGLQNFSVVVGSFSVKANAQGLQGTLKAAGYPAQIVLNSGNTRLLLCRAAISSVQATILMHGFCLRNNECAYFPLTTVRSVQA